MATAKLEKKIAALENFQEIVGKFVIRLGDPSKYEFRGEVIDLGEYGKGKCTCDHPVRYMFLIWGPNNEVAPVGCECINHFAAYNEALYNKLEGARSGLMEALAADERKKTQARQEAERAKVQPVYELARRRFLAVCKMHQDNINRRLPYALWVLQSSLMKNPEYKTINGYIKFYTRTILTIERTLGMYERGELQ